MLQLTIFIQNVVKSLKTISMCLHLAVLPDHTHCMDSAEDLRSRMLLHDNLLQRVQKNIDVSFLFYLIYIIVFVVVIIIIIIIIIIKIIF